MEQVPQHIAVIMDGNGRWAKQRFLPRKAGHKLGAKTVRNVIELCGKHQVKILTLFAFSSENWQRPADEVEALMALFIENLEKELPTLQKNNICLQIIGDRSRFNAELLHKMAVAEAITKNNDGLYLNLAVSYGGRWDIVNAVKILYQDLVTNKMPIDNIDETMLQQYLCLAEFPAPDLFIRAGGEQRLSNFMMWQLAYTDLYFTDTYWPDFDEKEFNKALDFYRTRERRFGLTSEQIQEQSC